MSRLEEMDGYVDQLADEHIAEMEDRREEFQALRHAIDNLGDPLLRRVLLKITDLIE